MNCYFRFVLASSLVVGCFSSISFAQKRGPRKPPKADTAAAETASFPGTVRVELLVEINAALDACSNLEKQSFDVSYDGRHYGFIRAVGLKQQSLVVDGVACEAFDLIAAEAQQLSQARMEPRTPLDLLVPDGLGFNTGNVAGLSKSTLFPNGLITPCMLPMLVDEHADIGPGRGYAGGDGDHSFFRGADDFSWTRYIGVRDHKLFLVRQSKDGKCECVELSATHRLLAISPDYQRIAFLRGDKAAGQTLSVEPLEGSKAQPFAQPVKSVSGFSFSNDGQHWIATIETEDGANSGNWYDGQPHVIPGGGAIGSYSRDLNCWSISRGGSVFLASAAGEVGPFDAMGFNFDNSPPLMSPDGKHFAIIQNAHRRGEYQLLLDGKPQGETHAQIRAVRFSADSQGLSYIAHDANGEAIFINGEQQPIAGTLSVSTMGETSSQSAYIVSTKTNGVAQSTLMINKTAHPCPIVGDAWLFTFTPGGTHVVGLFGAIPSPFLFLDGEIYKFSKMQISEMWNWQLASDQCSFVMSTNHGYQRVTVTFGK